MIIFFKVYTISIGTGGAIGGGDERGDSISDVAVELMIAKASDISLYAFTTKENYYVYKFTIIP